MNYKKFILLVFANVTIVKRNLKYSTFCLIDFKELKKTTY